MSNPTDPPGDKAARKQPDTGAGDPPADRERSGRIAYDERGNAVWEWQLQTGVYSRDISTQRLKKLDLNDLSIAETASHRRPPGLDDPKGRKARSGGGSNPYDNSSTGGGNVGNDPYNSAGRGALKPGPQPDSLRGGTGDTKTPPVRKAADMRKLQEWIELRKRVERNKRED